VEASKTSLSSVKASTQARKEQARTKGINLSHPSFIKSSRVEQGVPFGRSDKGGAQKRKRDRESFAVSVAPFTIKKNAYYTCFSRWSITSTRSQETKLFFRRRFVVE